MAITPPPESDFKEQLRAAAEACVKRQTTSLEHALRQAFYEGVAFELERRRLSNNDRHPY
jgi:hypothetical protein